MSTDSRQPLRPHTPARLPAALAEYADRLLLGTGLDATEALLIASSQAEAPPELASIQEALRAGWQLADDAS
jgi:hypothetical protein